MRSKQFYILELFRAKSFWDSRKKAHIPYKEGKPMLGDPLYTSINEHLGIELSRRDDIESLSYLALRLIKGKLPWEDIVEKDSKKDNYPLVLSSKINSTPDEFFQGEACI